ncbi:hypothetical protein QJU83_02160 [Pasteurella skyensis]|nr:hypothetical protein [Pasteurella skyensis]MDP8176346.1 hypothetical protein [Pasteurella skyensis]MDP8199141.1 hypothetical protein [Pasteurella skyensis]
MGFSNIFNILKLVVLAIALGEAVYITSLKKEIETNQAEIKLAQQKADHYAEANQQLAQRNTQNIEMLEQYQEQNKALSQQILNKLNEQDQQRQKIKEVLNEKNNQNWSNSVIPRDISRLLNTKNSNYRSQQSKTNTDNLPSNSNLSNASPQLQNK